MNVFTAATFGDKFARQPLRWHVFCALQTADRGVLHSRTRSLGGVNCSLKRLFFVKRSIFQKVTQNLMRRLMVWLGCFHQEAVKLSIASEKENVQASFFFFFPPPLISQLHLLNS